MRRTALNVAPEAAMSATDQTARLTSPTTSSVSNARESTRHFPGLRFGGSVALSGDTVAVADSIAHGFDGNRVSQVWAGTVYVFTRKAKTWTRQAYLTAPEPRHEQFGLSVALWGDRLAVGSSKEFCTLFLRKGSDWTTEHAR
jgi:hypothetical protein